MKRREVFNTAAIATATAATLVSCSQAGKSPSVQAGLPNIRWRMATSWPKSLGTFIGTQTVSRRVEEMTNGRFQITPFAAGELVPGLQVLDAVQAGTVYSHERGIVLRMQPMSNKRISEMA